MTDLTTTESSVPSEQVAAWGGASNLGTDDYRLSKILLMHGSSNFIKEGMYDARAGEFRDSITGDLLGEKGKVLEIVPFHLEKRWDVDVKDQYGNWKWDRSDYFDASNKDRPVSWSAAKFTESNGERYFVAYRLYVLRTVDVAEGVTKPYVIEFKKSSRETGRKIGQVMYQDNINKRLSPAAHVFEMTESKVSNKEHTWSVWEGVTGRRTNADEESAAFKMYGLLNSMDTSAVEKSEEAPTGNYVDDNTDF